MAMNRTDGLDLALPDGPALLRPPLSLLDLAVPLVDVADINARARDAQEAARAAGRGDDYSSDEARALTAIDRWENGFTYTPELSREDSMELYVEGTLAVGVTPLKRTDFTTPPDAWYDPFEVVAHDTRSTFGLRADSYQARAQRAMRALLAHEAYMAEEEFWTGARVPTNYHLAGSPDTPLTSPHRTIDGWGLPTAAPGTTLGVAVGLKRGMAALNQAIADADAGVGMIHATPYLVELWSSTAPGRFSQGQLFTINGNIIVPGYGYPGTGPNNARTFADGVTNTDTTLESATAGFSYADVGAVVAGEGIVEGTTIVSVTSPTEVELSDATTATATDIAVTVTNVARATGERYQWAYATDMVYKLKGAAHTLPHDVNETAPLVNVENTIEVRAERSWALITNQLLRAAVLVDTQTA